MKLRKSILLLLIATIVLTTLSVPVQADMETNPSRIVTNYLNPYNQPYPTTYYYGSGDTNLDGVFNSQDALYLQQILGGSKDQNIMSDVNGDGKVTTDDLTQIHSALSAGSALPSWWDQLTTREQRIDWVSKMMAIDKTNNLPTAYNYVCLNFASQTFLNFNYFRLYSSNTYYSGGQTIFNLPMYLVQINGPNLSHNINAILVGDDPGNFKDWLFLEPQYDNIVYPGDWSMVNNSKVVICGVTDVGVGGFSYTRLVEFFATTSGSTLTSISSQLLKTRPTVTQTNIINNTDRINPKIIPIGKGELLFEQQRKDLSKVTDIHLSSQISTGYEEAKPLTGSDLSSSLLDTYVGADGTVHIIWSGRYIEPGPYPEDNKYDILHSGIYYGKLDVKNGLIYDKTFLYELHTAPQKARILAEPSGKLHVIAQDTRYNKILWMTKNANTWSDATTLTDNIFNVYSSFTDIKQPSSYIFDACTTKSGEIELAWINVNNTTKINKILTRTYSPVSGSWSNATELASTTGDIRIRGLSMDNDGTNTYLAYWDGPGYLYPAYKSYRGNAYLMEKNSSSWSTPLCIDNSNSATSIRVKSDRKGKTGLVWDRRIDTLAKPVFSMKIGSGNWTSPEVLSVRPGAEVYYPDVCITEDNSIYVYWSSRDTGKFDIETYKVPAYNSSNETMLTPPILYYDFDNGNANDISGKGNNGTFAGTTTPSPVTGIKYSGMSFSDTGYIQAPNSTSLNIGTGDISISCWVKSTALSGKLIDKKGSNGVGYSLELYSGVPLFQVVDPNKGFYNYYTTSMPAINDNNWHLITVTMDRDSNTGVKIYTDGVLRVSQNALYRTGDLTNNGIMYVGRKCTGGQNFIGSMDELRIYNRVISGSEINNLYNNYFQILNLSFDDNLNDISGNGNSPAGNFVRFSEGRKNKSINFNESEPVKISNNPTQNLGTDDFTISFWMKRDNLNFSKSECIINTMKFGASPNGYRISVSKDKIEMHINGLYTISWSGMSNKLFDNKWHHVVISADRDAANAMSIYIDGLLWTSINFSYISTANISSNLDMILGDIPANCIFADYYEKFKGSLDSVGFYKKALSAVEVKALYNQ